MELIYLLGAVVACVIILLKYRKGAHKTRPPGPKGWPVFGNMFDLGDLPHQTLYRMRSLYGPLVWLNLGSVSTMVVQNTTTAAELFKKNDAAFCDRKVPDALTALCFDQGSLGWNPYGGYWRVLRRLCSMEFAVNKRMNETVELRRRIIDNMVRMIEEAANMSRDNGGSGEVTLNGFLFLTSFNLLGNLMLPRDLFDPKDVRGNQYFESLIKANELAGTPNVADFFPFLKKLDPLGIKKKMGDHLKNTLDISTDFIRQRKARQMKTNDKKDFLDALLEYRGDERDGPDKITDKDINIIIMEMFSAGSETTSISIEWGLTELLRNPIALRKAKEEINGVVGSRKVEERDIDSLPYLGAVIKETFRLHPPVPLLLPRNTIKDTNYMGYVIPKDTQVFINVWAISRDPDAWEDPLNFKPERFLGSIINYKGQNFELIPFGSGRRMCVGFPLAHRVVHLALATLVQAFDWEFPSGSSPETLDVQERLGLTLRKKNPLVMIPKKRPAEK